jgi:hypothetical protein
MAAIYTNEGEADMQKVVIDQLGSNLKIGLYKANSSIGGGKTVILSNLTPCDFSGYASQPTTWDAGSLDANGKFVRGIATYTFTHNAGAVSNNVLGYYVWDATNGVLLWYEAFSAPIVMASNGDAIPITPAWYSGDCSLPL